MRILCVAPYYDLAHVYGGPARSIPALCRAMAYQGVDVTVYTTNANGKRSLDVPVGQPLVKDGVRVVYFARLTHMRYFWAPGLARACLGRIAEFDIVHTNGVFNFPSLVAAAAARARSVPLLVSPQGELMPWGLAYKRFKKRLYMRLIGRRCIDGAAALHCTDAYEMEALQGLGFGKIMYVVPNGLDTHRFLELPPRGEMRQRLQISEGAVVILVLGRLHPVKRPDLAIKAFAQIAGVFSSAHLVLAGPDEAGMETGLLAIARRANCAERVHFAGLLNSQQVLQVLADADVFLMPSESENFGLSAAEAMAAGLPIVISDKIGISRVVRQVNAGQVVSLAAKSVADGLECLLKHPNRLCEIGLRARQIAVDTFDLAIVARQMIECYAEILKERKV